MAQFNTQQFIDEACDGFQPLHDLLDGAVPLDTIYKWRSRNSIPGDRLAEILWKLEKEQGAPLRLGKFFSQGVFG